jgi:purine nucleosidase
MSKKTKVIIDHDGGVDDLVAMAILGSRPETIELIGVVVIDADCFIEPAFEVSGKVLSMMGLQSVPVGKSSLKGVHEFPTEWRKDATNMNDMPSANTPAVLAAWEAANRHKVDKTGEQLLADLVMESDSPVKICVTGPLTNIAWCINTYGQKWTQKVSEIVIMGGAVDTKGNVFLKMTDGTAEWNIYWDAPAAAVVYGCHHVRKITFSLDSTNSVPVTSAFVQRFGAQNQFLLSQFVASSWAMCTHFIQIYGVDHGYYAWDALTATYVLEGEALVDLEAVPLDVVLGTERPDEGRTIRLANAPKEAFETSFVARNTKAEVFYNLVLECCRRP